MPTQWERGFEAGYEAGRRFGQLAFGNPSNAALRRGELSSDEPGYGITLSREPIGQKRKPSAWNKFVAANSKKKKYIYQSGAKRGKLNLKKMGVDYRKKKR